MSDPVGIPGEVKYDHLKLALKFKVTAAVTAGTVCTIDGTTGKLTAAGATSTGRAVVPLQHALAADDEVTGMIEGVVLLKCTATAKKGRSVTFAATGQVAPWTTGDIIGYLAEDCNDITIPVAVRIKG